MNFRLRQDFHNETGFTYVELLIGILITVLLTASISAIVTSLFGSQQVSTDSLNNTQQARQAFNKITNDLRYAYRINSVTATTVDYYTYVSDELTKCQLTYNQSNKTLIIQRGAGAPVILSQGAITNMAFTPGANIRNISVSMTADTGKKVPFTLSSNIYNINNLPTPLPSSNPVATSTPKPNATATPTATPTPTPKPTLTPTPKPTPTPTRKPTPTPTSRRW